MGNFCSWKVRQPQCRLRSTEIYLTLTAGLSLVVCPYWCSHRKQFVRWCLKSVEQLCLSSTAVKTLWQTAPKLSGLGQQALFELICLRLSGHWLTLARQTRFSPRPRPAGACTLSSGSVWGQQWRAASDMQWAEASIDWAWVWGGQNSWTECPGPGGRRGRLVRCHLRPASNPAQESSTGRVPVRLSGIRGAVSCF